MKKNQTHHFNRIEFAVKLGKENAFMASLLNHTFECGNLVSEVILFTENACHAAIIVLKQTDRCTFGTKVTHIEATLFKSLLEPPFLPRFHCHLLDSATVFWKWVGFQNDGVLLLSLCSSFDLFISKALSALGANAA